MRALSAFLSVVFGLNIATAEPLRPGEPRVRLTQESGFVEPEILWIDGKPHQRGFWTQAFEINEFESLQSTDPDAWMSLRNHHRYGEVSLYGFAVGTGGALSLLLFASGKLPVLIAALAAVGGFAYGINARHMSRHNLNKGINRLNGVADVSVNENKLSFTIATFQ